MPLVPVCIHHVRSRSRLPFGFLDRGMSHCYDQGGAKGERGENGWRVRCMKRVRATRRYMGLMVTIPFAFGKEMKEEMQPRRLDAGLYGYGGGECQ